MASMSLSVPSRWPCSPRPALQKGWTDLEVASPTETAKDSNNTDGLIRIRSPVALYYPAPNPSMTKNVGEQRPLADFCSHHRQEMAVVQYKELLTKGCIPKGSAGLCP